MTEKKLTDEQQKMWDTLSKPYDHWADIIATMNNAVGKKIADDIEKMFITKRLNED